MSTSKTGNSSLTGRFHSRTFSIDSSLEHWYSPLLHSLPFWVVCLLTALLVFSFPSLQFVGLFLRPLFFSSFPAPVNRLFGHPLLLKFVAPWPAFLPPGLGCTLRRQEAVSLVLLSPSNACTGWVTTSLFLHILFPDGPLPCCPARV